MNRQLCSMRLISDLLVITEFGKYSGHLEENAFSQDADVYTNDYCVCHPMPYSNKVFWVQRDSRDIYRISAIVSSNQFPPISIDMRSSVIEYVNRHPRKPVNVLLV